MASTPRRADNCSEGRDQRAIAPFVVTGYWSNAILLPLLAYPLALLMLGAGIACGSGARQGIVTELAVRIRHGADAVWEGQAQSLTDTIAPDADTNSIAGRLAAALFTDFPGESGRSIEVK